MDDDDWGMDGYEIDNDCGKCCGCGRPCGPEDKEGEDFWVCPGCDELSD